MLKTSARFRVAGHVFSRPTRSISIGLLPHLRSAVQTQCSNQKRTYSEAAPQVEVPNTDACNVAAAGESSRIADHLNRVFAPLQFPPELATRILTHASYRDWRVANNNRLTFIGRRVLKSYMLLFLHSASTSGENYDLEDILEKVIETHAMGEFVAPRWGIGRVMRWTPVDSASGTASIGLYKIQGTMVEAVMGGMYHQFGGAVSHRVFHTRFLPHLLLSGKPRGGLPNAFHDSAMKICKEMGGPEGDLLQPPAHPDSTRR